jgi:vacuolar-type H+-ATPase catalytic subunit A/Vma1
MSNIYDGIQRPLKAIQEVSQSIYIPRGIATPALDTSVTWDFNPLNFQVNIGLYAQAGNMIIYPYLNFALT